MKIQIILFLLLPLMMTAQSSHKFFIRFTDKNGSLYSVSNPSAFLSPRSIARRNVQQVIPSAEDLPVNQNYIDSVTAKGATVFTRSKWFNGVTVLCDSNVLADIMTLPFVQSAVKVFKSAKPKPRDAKYDGRPFNNYSELRTLSYNYGDSYNQIHLMNGDYLHDNGYSGEGMQIALLDAGFYHVDSLPAFDSLRTRNAILGTWDFVNNESSVFEDDSHGMEVLSTIAGNVPGELVGTAPHASFWLLRSEDAFTENIIEEYNWDAAAEFADSAGADVISSSLGYTRFDDTLASHTYADMNGHTCPSSIAADIAVSKGMLVMVSAGNSGNDDWHYISAPSDGDNVLAVAAVDSLGNYVSFSSHGPSSDGDIKPNVAAKGLRATLSSQFGPVATGSGTSFACPILAGSATCLMQAHPGVPVMRVKSAIEQSANYFNTPTDTLGYGIPNFASADFLLGVAAMHPDGDALFSVYPNPFTDDISIRIYSATAENAEITVFDAIGKKVVNVQKELFAGDFQIISIPVPSNLSNGIYYLQVITRNSEFRNKLIRTNR